MYLRLVGESLECYKYLELLYNDYRKLKRKNRNGGKHHTDMGGAFPGSRLEEGCLSWLLHELRKESLNITSPSPVSSSHAEQNGRRREGLVT